MKKISLFTLVLSLLASTQSCKNPCKGVITYYSIDSRLSNYVFKEGSYWIYRDSVDGTIDSQYVFKYEKLVHTSDSILVATHDPCQAPRYSDELRMYLLCYQNNVFVDTCLIDADYNGTLMAHPYEPNKPGINIFTLDVSIPRVIDEQHSYIGMLDSLPNSNGSPFRNVSIFRIAQSATNYLYPYDTDLYFSSGYGIVKIVEHRPTGDVPWTLIRYNLIN